MPTSPQRQGGQGTPTQHRPVAFITGAGGGLGTALTHAFVEAGWRVAAAARRLSPSNCRPEVMDLEVDVTDPSGIAVAVGQVASHWQRLDALICCAGLTADGLLLDLAPEDWTSVLTVNLKGASFCAQAVLPQMQHQQSGHIIFVGSYSARAGSAGQANYAAAKAGLIGLTQSLARETAPDNIRVNAVLPGILATGMTAKLSARRWRQLVDQNLLRRANDLGEASRFIVVLAGMRNVSGQVLQIDSRLARWT